MARGVITGKCIYCGREQDVLADTQNRANEIVTKNCYCNGKEIECRTKSAFKKIEAMFGKESEARDFIELHKTAISTIQVVAKAIIERKIVSCTLKITDGTASFSLDSDGNLKISRKRTDEMITVATMNDDIEG